MIAEELRCVVEFLYETTDALESANERIAELERELAEALKDRERLDWLSKYGWYRAKGQTTWVIQTGKDEDLRAAIDAILERKSRKDSHMGREQP